jgi:hypothetical protein
MARFEASTASRVRSSTWLTSSSTGREAAAVVRASATIASAARSSSSSAQVEDVVLAKPEGDEAARGLLHRLQAARADRLDRPLEAVGGGLEALDERRDQAGVLEVGRLAEERADQVGLDRKLRHRRVGENRAVGEARRRRLRRRVAKRAIAGGRYIVASSRQGQHLDQAAMGIAARFFRDRSADRSSARHLGKLVSADRPALVVPIPAIRMSSSGRNAPPRSPPGGARWRWRGALVAERRITAAALLGLGQRRGGRRDQAAPPGEAEQIGNRGDVLAGDAALVLAEFDEGSQATMLAAG